MKPAVKKFIKVFLIAIITLSTLFILFVFILFRSLFPFRTVQVLYSPDYKHKAVLQRIDGFDLIFFVKVDGRKVYSSPDFAPNRTVDFHERLVWDKSSTIVVLEVIGRRLFGYDIKTGKALLPSELLSVEYAPDPNLWEFRFEGTWPKDLLKKERKNNQ